MVVNVSVSDLRSVPEPAQWGYQIDYNQHTQVIYNEGLLARPSTTPGWSEVIAVEQPFYNGTNSSGGDIWVGYPGYVETNHLLPVPSLPHPNLTVTANWIGVYKRLCTPYACLPEDVVIYVTAGTRFTGVMLKQGWWEVLLANGSSGFVIASAIQVTNASLDLNRIRILTVQTAQNMLGWYYFWGGRSMFNADLWTSHIQTTGVDCSGLVSLSYRSHGVILPRNANDIFRAVVPTSSLQPGDLLFLSNSSDPAFIFHVMMVVTVQNGGVIVESGDDNNTAPLVQNNNGTRMISALDKFGLTLGELVSGGTIPQGYGGFYVFYGSLPNSIIDFFRSF